MKIAYLLYTGAAGESGVLKKIAEQAGQWLSQGAAVKLFIQNAGRGIWPGLKDLDVVTFVPGSRRERFSRRGLGVGAVLDWQPELVYQRFDTYWPAWGYLMRQVPTVLEVNTDDLTEYRLQRNRRSYWFHRATRGLTLKKAAGLVFVTRALAARPYFARYRRPSIVIANGISLEAYKPLSPAQNDQPRLVFIGTTGWPWHGVEKVVRLAGLAPQWQFDIVGYTAADVPVPASDNVIFHGHLSQDEYERILARADVGIGTLAFHKIHMEEGCPLKIRQYLAYGLPIILAYEDTDFPEGHPMILRLPNTPDTVEANLGAIRRFVESVKGRRIDRSSIRGIDTAEKERERLRFFAHCLQEAAVMKGCGPANVDHDSREP
ncbi:MAG: glycosyltransferase family 4 protein [Sedimentisphaerales bacterium]|nr:glycosyltransferase family 4 protein [Sedimentisphaerales bacterium]